MSLAQQRRTGLARTPTSATLGGMFLPSHLQAEEGLWRRHSMNDAVRPDMMSFGAVGLNGDGMATVDEAAIEDGDAEDSPQMWVRFRCIVARTYALILRIVCVA
jgi:hypothetical protein